MTTPEWLGFEEAESRKLATNWEQMPLGSDPWQSMCLGSEMLGERLDDNWLRCKTCHCAVKAFSPTENLVPVHYEVRK